MYRKYSSILVQLIVLIWILSIPLKNSIYQISVGILILLFFVDVYITKSLSTAKNILTIHQNIFLSFGLIVLSMSISNLFGIGAPKAWYLECMFIIRYGFIAYLLLYFYLKDYINPKRIVLMVLASLALQGVDGLYQHFYNVDFISGHEISNGAWLTGAVFYYNPFGMFMSIGASLTIALLINYEKFNLTKLHMTFLMVLSFIFTYDLLYSLSRASWVSFGIFVGTIALLHFKQINTKVFLFLCSMLVLIVAFIVNDHDILLRFHQLLQGDSSNRYEIWGNSIRAFLDHPIVGYGLNSFKEIVSHEYSATHNTVLEILLYMGIVGFMAFTYLLILLFNEIKRIKNTIYFSFFISLLVISQFDNSVISSKIFLSILTVFSFFILSHKIKNNDRSNTIGM